jgi:sodium-dependent dicarboxylate transporter 2/3/5
MTPIAHVFPILAMNAAKITVSYFAYMAFAVPVGLISFVLMILMFRFIMHPDMSKLTNLDISSMKSEMKKISKKEIWSLSIFIFVILLWIIPSFFQHISPSFYSFINNYGTAMPPMLGVILLCIVRVDGEQLVSIPDAMKNGIPWASLIMCAGTLALGSAMTDKTIGLKSYLQNSMSSALSGISPIVLLIIFGLWAMLQTNVSSNMVTATLVSTVATGILNSMPTSELSLAAVVCMIGMLSAYAFATPPSMPHIAITCSSGYSNTSSVLKYGSLLMVLSLIVSLCIGYPLACLFM